MWQSAEDGFHMAEALGFLAYPRPQYTVFHLNSPPPLFLPGLLGPPPAIPNQAFLLTYIQGSIKFSRDSKLKWNQLNVVVNTMEYYVNCQLFTEKSIL